MAIETAITTKARFGSSSFTVTEEVETTGQLVTSISVPAAVRALLNPRTDNNTGWLTLANLNQGLEVGDKVDVYWPAGQRVNMTVTIVTVDQIVVDGGSGDNLPDEDTYVYVSKPVVRPLELNCDLLQSMVLYMARRGTFTFFDSEGALLLTMPLPSKGFDWWINGSPRANPLAGLLIATIKMSHDTAAKNVVEMSLNYDAENDAPSLTAPAAQETDEDTPLVIASGFVVTDPDSRPVYASLDVTNGTATLSTTDGLVFSIGNGVADASMAFRGSPSAVEAAFNGITYTPTGNYSGAALMSFVVSDGDGASVSRTIAVTVVEVPDVPVVTCSGGNSTYTEGGADVFVDDMVTVTDEDSANLTGATIQITGNFHPSPQDILKFTTQNGISGVWSNATGTMTLSGSSSVANYQTALRTVRFSHIASQNPSDDTRTVTFIVSDGVVSSSPSTKDVDVVPVNNAPVVATSEGTTDYLDGGSGGPVVIDAEAQVSDPDDTNMEQFEVHIVDGYEVGDVLAGPDGFGVTGSWNAGTQTFTYTGTSTSANYTTLIRQVTFDTTEDPVTERDVVVSFNAFDGDDWDASPATKTVHVNPIDNSPPEITFPETDPYSIEAVEDATGTLLTLAATDAEGDVEYSLTGVDAGLFTVDPDTGAVTWDSAADVDDYTFNGIATDEDEVEDTVVVNVHVVPLPPGNLVVVPTTGDEETSLDVTWDNGGTSFADNYRIERAQVIDGVTGAYSFVADHATPTTESDGSLTPGAYYRYRVRTEWDANSSVSAWTVSDPVGTWLLKTVEYTASHGQVYWRSQEGEYSVDTNFIEDLPQHGYVDDDVVDISWSTGRRFGVSISDVPDANRIVPNWGTGTGDDQPPTGGFAMTVSDPASLADFAILDNDLETLLGVVYDQVVTVLGDETPSAIEFNGGFISTFSRVITFTEGAPAKVFGAAPGLLNQEDRFTTDTLAINEDFTVSGVMISLGAPDDPGPGEPWSMRYDLDGANFGKYGLFTNNNPTGFPQDLFTDDSAGTINTYLQANFNSNSSADLISFAPEIEVHSSINEGLGADDYLIPRGQYLIDPTFTDPDVDLQKLTTNNIDFSVI